MATGPEDIEIDKMSGLVTELTPADQALKSTVHAGLFITFVAAMAGIYVTKIQKSENIRIPLGELLS